MRRALQPAVGIAAAVAAALSVVTAQAAGGVTYTTGAISNLTSSCSGQNAEVEQAVDPSLGYVYEAWMGCSGIAFARSLDGGSTWSRPSVVPGSVGSNVNSWDPALAVGPEHTVYAAFMVSKGAQWYPVVAASPDFGAHFPVVSSLVPPDPKNWGDRDFIAVGPDGTVYVTYDYGPERTSVTFICATAGSCAFATGDLNVVMQKSADGLRTWSRMSYVSPGFPASGGDSGPMAVEPSGKIDVLYQGYQITNTTTYAMNPAYSYFTSSTDGGASWTAPVRVGAQGGTMSLSEWWIDGDITRDAGGNLYASWDTQGANGDGTPNDTGWISVSTDGGRHWTQAIQATPDRLNAPHIMEVAGGASGVAYVGWLSSSDPRGYAQYLRTFSITHGWLSDPLQLQQFGDPNVWPGDTFGISALSSTQVVLSWGSAVAGVSKKSDIWATGVRAAFG